MEIGGSLHDILSMIDGKFHDRRLRFALWVPWERAAPAERFRALELAAEIIFPDKSAVSWTCEGWRPDYTHMIEFSGSADADEFILDQNAAMIQAQALWTVKH